MQAQTCKHVHTGPCFITYQISIWGASPHYAWAEAQLTALFYHTMDKYCLCWRWKRVWGINVAVCSRIEILEESTFRGLGPNWVFKKTGAYVCFFSSFVISCKNLTSDTTVTLHNTRNYSKSFLSGSFSIEMKGSIYFRLDYCLTLNMPVFIIVKMGFKFKSNYIIN